MTDKGFGIVVNLVETPEDYPNVPILQRIFRRTLSCLNRNYIEFLWNENENVFGVGEFPGLNEIFRVLANEELKEAWSGKVFEVAIEKKYEERTEDKTFMLFLTVHDLHADHCTEWCSFYMFEAYIYILDTLQKLALFKIASCVKQPKDVPSLRLPTSFVNETKWITAQLCVEKYGAFGLRLRVR